MSIFHSMPISSIDQENNIKLIILFTGPEFIAANKNQSVNDKSKLPISFARKGIETFLMVQTSIGFLRC